MAKSGRDLFGSLLGVVTFLGGIGLLVLVFDLAYRMFTTPPHEALGLTPGKALDIPTAGTNLTGVVIRIGLLLIMAITGSLIANRGVSLYQASRAVKEGE